LRVDGGASENALVLELQADQLQVPVQRPTIRETTALGAAYLAGLAEGVWSSVDEISAKWSLDVEVAPSVDQRSADAAYDGWRRAVERSLAWAR
jgi:glycerol kinase